jgi:hypothetical protein
VDLFIPAGPHTGKAATCAFNAAVFTKFYKPVCTRVVFTTSTIPY